VAYPQRVTQIMHKPFSIHCYVHSMVDISIQSLVSNLTSTQNRVDENIVDKRDNAHIHSQISPTPNTNLLVLDLHLHTSNSQIRPLHAIMCKHITQNKRQQVNPDNKAAIRYDSFSVRGDVLVVRHPETRPKS
jgi:hypothetical protein